MVEKRARARAGADADEGLSKVQLQRRIDETRDSISSTVEEIKETVSDQYEAVKETVADVIGWNEEFSKNPVVWGLGALSVGLIIGYSIATVRESGPPARSGRRSRSSNSQADNFFDGLSRVGMNVVLPVVTNKVRDLFGVDLSQQLLGLTSARSEPARRRKSPATRSKKATTKKRATKKRAAK